MNQQINSDDTLKISCVMLVWYIQFLCQHANDDCEISLDAMLAVSLIYSLIDVSWHQLAVDWYTGTCLL